MGRVILGCFLTLALAAGAHAAARTKAALWLEYEAARPGDTLWAGVQLRMPGKLHTYWQYGGDAGGPTEIQWQLPPFIKPGPIHWPVPEKHEDSGLFTYVYYQEAVLLVPLHIASNAPAGSVELRAKVSWLECELTCLPGAAEVSASLVIGPEPRPSPRASALTAARQQLPQTGAKVTARWDAPRGDVRFLDLQWDAGPGTEAPDFFPLPDESYSVAGATTVKALAPGRWLLRKEVKRQGQRWPARLPGLLVAQFNGQIRGFSVELTPAGDGPTAAPSPPGQAAARPGLWVYLAQLLGAFLGGFILNFMPCVLPVVSLKILSFVNQGHSQPREVRRLGLIYGVGVLTSFLVLALVVLGARLAGQGVSWGIQLQNPVFVMVLAVVMTLVGLNLFGVFEIMPASGLLGAASTLAAKEGAAGAFFNGVLATFLATACTAPILGAAVGFAFTQPWPGLIIPFFLVIGLGMALPYVVLSFNPSWLKWLPKPGAWMERFKQFMGFPMLATTVWLLSLAVEALGANRALWLGMVLLLVALAAWIYGVWVQGQGRKAAWLPIALLAALSLFFLENLARWRHPPEPTTGAEEIIRLHPNGIEWRRWSPEALAAARAQGRPVLVDFTASWCLTCKLNAKTSLEIPVVREKLKAINAVALLENSYRKNQTVLDELARHGRAGVPLVLVYPKDPNKPPIILPELLTPRLVLDALEQAAR
ncbi:protein-disulfide reductase DsbD family protein [Fontisphaera persica]|uniref:protein-disulfide reductase DsbD family protein n=1 Tax=Fontisphaera persica TaxID=2974023 RepID=UPI0024C0CF53|nr:thioredoxin family protein [Fontisphaera persica]WCJ59310.1 protein-disulfide reductase DsbD family protein [Fontisphaera persica]